MQCAAKKLVKLAKFVVKKVICVLEEIG